MKEQVTKLQVHTITVTSARERTTTAQTAII